MFLSNLFVTIVSSVTLAPRLNVPKGDGFRQLLHRFKEHASIKEWAAARGPRATRAASPPGTAAPEQPPPAAMDTCHDKGSADLQMSQTGSAVTNGTSEPQFRQQVAFRMMLVFELRGPEVAFQKALVWFHDSGVDTRSAFQLDDIR
ncbi:hypothetical protein QOT17_003316 [Balamuthia mandrillaris]